MKRLLMGVGLLLLAGCNVVIEPTPLPPPNLKVLDATYRTNYVRSDGAFIICDNRQTVLTYRFQYQGRLDTWTSYLEGQELGRIAGERTFDPESQGVSPYEGGFEVEYVMDPNFAPYAGAQPEPSAITVTPVPQPAVIGATKLYLTLRGVGPDATYSSNDIPVVVNCP